MRWVALLVFVLMHLCIGAVGLESVVIESPNDELVLLLDANEGDGVYYTLSFKDQVVIRRSGLKLGARVGKKAKSARLTKIVSVGTPKYVQDDWTHPWGKSSVVENRFQEVDLRVQYDSGVGDTTIQFRVFNDGVGIRYHYGTISPKPVGIVEETLFDVPNNPMVWATRGWKSYLGPFQMSAFSNVVKKVSDVGKDANTPITMQMGNDVFLSFHEAALYDIEGVSPKAVSPSTLDFVSSFTKPAQSTFTSAWRTIQVASSAGGLARSDLISNLNPPPVNDVSVTGKSFLEWVKPGLTMWDWRLRGSYDTHGFFYTLNEATMKRLIDFASLHEIPYLLIDDGWYHSTFESKTGNLLNLSILNVQTLAQYAATKNVKLILYVDYTIMKNSDMETVLRTYHEWGIAGIKHGFTTNKKSNIAEVYEEIHRVIERCAYYELLYAIHEPPKPTGWERTFPHILTTEYTDSMLDNPRKRATTPPELVTFPFIHHLAAPVDRSSGMFALDTYILRSKCHRQLPTTVMSQIAQGFCFPTGLWTLVDNDESYEAKPDLLNLVVEMNDFFHPEETWIEGEIGQSIIVTKKLGRKLITCGLTASEEANVSVNITKFLPADSNFVVTIYSDGPDGDGAISTKGPEIPKTYAEKVAIANDVTKRELYEIETFSLRLQGGAITRGKPISVRVGNGGGFCVKYESSVPVPLPTPQPVVSTKRPSIAPTNSPMPPSPYPTRSTGLFEQSCSNVGSSGTCNAQRCKWENNKCKELTCASVVPWLYDGVASAPSASPSLVTDFQYQHDDVCPDLPFASYDYPSLVLDGTPPPSVFDSEGTAKTRLDTVAALLETPFTVDVDKLTQGQMDQFCLTMEDCRIPPYLTIIRRAGNGSIWKPSTKAFRRQVSESNTYCCNVNGPYNTKSRGMSSNFFTLNHLPAAANVRVSGTVSDLSHQFLPVGSTFADAKVVKINFRYGNENLYAYMDLTCSAGRDLYRRTVFPGLWKGSLHEVGYQVILNGGSKTAPPSITSSRLDLGIPASPEEYGDSIGAHSANSVSIGFVGVIQKKRPFSWLSLSNIWVNVVGTSSEEMVVSYLRSALTWALQAAPKGNWPVALIYLHLAQQEYENGIGSSNSPLDLSILDTYGGPQFQAERPALEYLVAIDLNSGKPRFMGYRLESSECLDSMPSSFVLMATRQQQPPEAGCWEHTRSGGRLVCSKFCTPKCEAPWTILQEARSQVWDTLQSQVPKCSECPGLIGLVRGEIPLDMSHPLEQTAWYPQCLPFQDSQGALHSSLHYGTANQLPDYSTCKICTSIHNC